MRHSTTPHEGGSISRHPDSGSQGAENLGGGTVSKGPVRKQGLACRMAAIKAL